MKGPGGAFGRADAAIIAIVIAAAAIAAAALPARGAEGPAALRAELYEDGALTRVLPLDEAADFVVHTKWGYNRVVVEGGAVRVAEADCASLACVHSGAKARPGEMVACLPHRLVIRVSGGAGGETPYDAVSY
ncbi:MAG: NusG domain II-containing protein [Clostridiales Family XIII bacterium]|jgi:hypothetical protein|nr:NusG domain II-containing protein [Clostridiales Family XIII bacterium]